MKVDGYTLTPEEESRFHLLDDDGKLRQKILNKRVNADKIGLAYKMSVSELLDELEFAGIKSSDWCVGKFSLSRFKDEGDYIVGNCRFLLQGDNAKERKDYIGPRHCLSWEEYTLWKQKLASERRVEYEKTAHQSYLGNKNSQFGTRWITNGVESRKIKSSEEIPSGWTRGRH